ncbi:MAG: hypothetical protein KJ915_07115 [Candidatus Omnitrophica bacterium]|nr:hypothetical protein [Candidatus Omnitrophota bacterium]
MDLLIGGIYIKIKSNNSYFLRKTADEFKSFVLENKTSDYFLIEVIDDYIPKEIDAISVKRKDSVFKAQADEFIASIDLGKKIAKVHVADLAGVFNCFLRVFYSIVLLDNNGFLVHAAGLSFQGKGYVFSGASESGKTTTARMAQDCKVFSDELVLIRQINKHNFIYSTPFHGEFEGDILSDCVDLEALAFLSKDIPRGYKRLSKIEIFTSLMVNIFFFSWDDESNQKLINLVSCIGESQSGYKVDLFNYDIRRVINGISKNNNSQ